MTLHAIKPDDLGNPTALLGRRVYTYYPVYDTFCWPSRVIEVKGEQLRLQHAVFENLRDWFHFSNVMLVD